MKVLFDIQDNKADFIMELLNSFSLFYEKRNTWFNIFTFAWGCFL